MSCVKKVAEMLGVRLNNIFRVKGRNDNYYFNDSGLMRKVVNKDGIEYSKCDDEMLTGLLNGEFEVDEKCALPTQGELCYFYQGIEGKVITIMFDPYSLKHLALLKLGLLYKSAEEVSNFDKGKNQYLKLLYEYRNGTIRNEDKNE